MCAPWVPYVIMAIMGAAEASSNYQAQKKNFEAQAKYQEDMAKANNEVAQTQLEQLRIRQSQEREANLQEKLRAEREASRQQSTAVVSLAEAGNQGQSAAMLLRNFQTQEGLYKAALARQLEMNNQQLESNIEAIRRQADYDNTGMNRPLFPANKSELAIGIGKSAASAYAGASKAGG